MNVYAVISEFNPFHNGHGFLVRRVKERDPDTAVVAVMSGSFVQRGEPAIIDKYARAEAAVRCGVDLVLELPAPWCFSGAEFFALGGVSVANGLGVCDTLVFGSESGEITELKTVSERIGTPNFADECRRLRETEKRANTAEIRAQAYAGLYGGTDVFCGSNNLLALEYLKAMKKLDTGMRAETVRRVGSDFNCEALVGICSASAIRSELRRGRKVFSGYMPEASEAVLHRELYADRVYGLSKLDTAVIAMLICSKPDSLSGFMEVDDGIEHRLCSEALCSRSINELVDNCKTKRFSESRVRRAILSCILGVRMSDVETPPLFTNLLCANERGREVLSAARKRADIAVLSKMSDAKKLSGAALSQYELHMRAERLCELCCEGEPRRVGAVMV